MSQDTAFSEDKKDETFKFDEEVTTPASPAETAEDTPSSSPDEKTDDVATATKSESEDEEQRVPYSRFKRKVEEAEDAIETVKALEARLEALEASRKETVTEGSDAPAEWTALYGDSQVAKDAWKIQLTREQKLREESVKEAIDYLKKSQEAEKASEQENEDTLDEYIESLQKKVGKPLSKKMEEDILTIVDEFSPTGEDGKYLSMISPDKAYEIYELRSSKRTNATAQARGRVAALTSETSEGDADTSSDTTFKRGWDNWREAL